jgi:hypothetical protein
MGTLRQRGGGDTAQVSESNELTARGTNPLLPACAAAAGSISLAGSRFCDSPLRHDGAFYSSPETRS